jgi:hypothetical protein
MKTEDRIHFGFRISDFGFTKLRLSIGNRQSAIRNSFVCLLPLALCLLVPASVVAQKKPKPALSVKQARSVIAAAPGFKLNKSAVKIKEISPAGVSPVSVSAEVTEAFRLASVEDERVEQNTGVFKRKRWRAVEFRTGDRSWDEFDYLAAPVGAERLEAARGALEELVTEYAARVGSNKDEGNSQSAEKPAADNAKGEEKAGAKKEKNDKKSAEPLTRGPLTIKQLSLMGSSAVAEVSVEATFTLSKDASGNWVVTEVAFGVGPGVELAALRRSINSQKAERVRAELAIVRDALESYRRERGFYVVAEDSVVLLDHLNPRFIKQIIRLDPWHNPYRYTGTTGQFTLASDGPDGKPGTADDVTVSR